MATEKLAPVGCSPTSCTRPVRVHADLAAEPGGAIAADILHFKIEFIFRGISRMSSIRGQERGSKKRGTKTELLDYLRASEW